MFFMLLCRDTAVVEVPGTSLLHVSPYPLAPGLSLDLVTATKPPASHSDLLLCPSVLLMLGTLYCPLGCFSCSTDSTSTGNFHLALGTGSA